MPAAFKRLVALETRHSKSTASHTEPSPSELPDMRWCCDILAYKAKSWSGNRLFRAALARHVPTGISAAAVQDALEAISGEIMVDFTVGAPPVA